jgi:hypothetical protein
MISKFHFIKNSKRIIIHKNVIKLTLSTKVSQPSTILYTEEESEKVEPINDSVERFYDYFQTNSKNIFHTREGGDKFNINT